jgi:acyl-CoA thioesterase I
LDEMPDLIHKTRSGIRLCIFGDSIVWGAFDSMGLGWVGRLREESLRRMNPDTGEYVAVYNCGVGGDKLSDVLSRFGRETEARRPVAIAVAIGINDVKHDDYPGTAVDEFKERYGNLLERAQNCAKDVIAITPTNVDEDRPEHGYRNQDIAALAAVVNECAAAQKVTAVNVFGSMTPADLTPDGIHPGRAGHQKLFEIISPAVFALPSLQTGS